LVALKESRIEVSPDCAHAFCKQAIMARRRMREGAIASAIKRKRATIVRGFGGPSAVY
jgi:hypothetical protein